MAMRQDEPTISVKGCLQNYSAKGTVGTTEHGYLLTNVTPGNGDETKRPAPPAQEATTSAGAPTGTTGASTPQLPTSGTPAPAVGNDSAQPPVSKADTAYLLEGSDKELKDHVGHRVEVTGTVQPFKDETLKSQEARFQVASIRSIASSCSSRPK
jgi:hypothetical protein